MAVTTRAARIHRDGTRARSVQAAADVPTPAAEPDVLVLGGGPAGCAAARLLARWGLEVVLVERSLGSSDSSQSLAESLPPSARKALAAADLLGVVEAGGFHPNTGNTALWGGERRSDGFGGGGAGFHVLRSRLDRLLRKSAANAGATVAAGTARRPVSGEGGEWVVSVDWGPNGAGSGQLRPKWLLDCTGRAGVLARRSRTLEREAPTLGVLRRYEAVSGDAGWPGIDAGHALAESFDRGWAWSVPTSSRERHVALMLDPELHPVMAEASDLSAALEAEAAATRLIRQVVRGGRPVGGAWAVAASMYSAPAAAGRALLVGDAASFVDPMSSYGVKKALASAWLAAVVARTAIQDSAMESAAVALYCRREREMYEAMRDGMADHVRGPGEFWERRAAWLADRSGPSAGLAPTSPAAAQLRDDPGVVAAFRELRAGSGLLRAGSRRTVERPMVAGNRIVMAPALVTPRFPDGVRYLRNVDLLRVAQMAPAGGDPGVLFEKYVVWAAQEEAPPVELADFLGVLAVLVADAVLVPL